MKKGMEIRILPSKSLEEMGLGGIVGQKGEIVEVVGKFDNAKGCWVRLPKPYLGESEWYIPSNSIGI